MLCKACSRSRGTVGQLSEQDAKDTPTLLSARYRASSLLNCNMHFSTCALCWPSCFVSSGSNAPCALFAAMVAATSLKGHPSCPSPMPPLRLTMSLDSTAGNFSPFSTSLHVCHGFLRAARCIVNSKCGHRRTFSAMRTEHAQTTVVIAMLAKHLRYKEEPWRNRN